MKGIDPQETSRRERQILDALHRDGPATVSDVRARIPEPPTYSTVRTLLGIMEEKGLVTHTERGKAYVYAPAASSRAARKSALRHLVETFFQGSAEEAAIALLQESRLDPASLERLRKRVAQAKQEGR